MIPQEDVKNLVFLLFQPYDRRNASITAACSAAAVTTVPSSGKNAVLCSGSAQPAPN